MERTPLLLILGSLLVLFIDSASRPEVLTLEKHAVPKPSLKKKVIFIAGACSHESEAHEHYAGCELLAAELNRNIGDTVEALVFQLWPSDTTVLDDASTIVLYMDGGGGHLALKHLKHLNSLMKKGVGLVCLHYAVEVPTNKGGSEFKEWLGGYFETYWSVNPTWNAVFQALPDVEVTRGVKPFSAYDEWYYHMRFQNNMQDVMPVLTAVPPTFTFEGKDGAHSGNEFVRNEKDTPQHVAWITERKDGGRGFGFTGGHYHKNWGDENIRKLVLNGIVWTAKVMIPPDGVHITPLTEQELQKNLDVKPCK